MTTTYCTGTQAATDEEAIATVGAETYRRWWGRKMCATCHGAVLANRDGSLRKHKPGSNR